MIPISCSAEASKMNTLRMHVGTVIYLCVNVLMAIS